MARVPRMTTPPALAAKPALAARTYDLELVTPLLGGSATPQKNDPELPVRGTSIRGLLRFWWRATRAGAFQSAEKLRQAEEAIWGSTQVPARVTLTVEILDAGHPSPPVRAFKDDVVPAYAAFPLTSRGNVGEVREGVKFRVTLRYPAELEGDVRAAMWAWTTLGGIGGRTRRGFGALQLLAENGEFAPRPTPEALKIAFETYVDPQQPPEPGTPSLAGARWVRTRTTFSDARGAWYAAVAKLKAYRVEARRPNQGRSYWCEPDALRRLRGQAAARHREPVNTVNKYPRAIFGLPIIYHFKDGEDPSSQLKGGARERLASPLVLRPFAFSDGWYGLALRLCNSFHTAEQLLPGGIAIGNRRVEHGLTSQEAAHLKERGFPLPLAPDVLDAFLDHFAG